MNPNLTKVWLIRAGSRGEDETAALETGRAIIGFHDIGDLSVHKDPNSIAVALVHARNSRAADIQARQLWAFSRHAQIGDLVVLPLKTKFGRIALGRLIGNYEYIRVEGVSRHTRKVDWMRPDVPRSVFEKDLLLSFGAFLTVCQVQRGNAAQRIAAIIAGKGDPGEISDG